MIRNKGSLKGSFARGLLKVSMRVLGSGPEKKTRVLGWFVWHKL